MHTTTAIQVIIPSQSFQVYKTILNLSITSLQSFPTQPTTASPVKISCKYFKNYYNPEYNLSTVLPNLHHHSNPRHNIIKIILSVQHHYNPDYNLPATFHDPHYYCNTSHILPSLQHHYNPKYILSIALPIFRHYIFIVYLTSKSSADCTVSKGKLISKKNKC